VYFAFLFFFFFSSRRRHTRWTGDWSSDVCSSDLRTTEKSAATSTQGSGVSGGQPHGGCRDRQEQLSARPAGGGPPRSGAPGQPRSEERRVGKEGRSRWWARH